MNEFLASLSWQEIIAKFAYLALGGALYALLNFFIRFTYKKYQEWKFPIGGEFITEYEDEKDGEKIIERAPCSLKQSGNRITGATTLGNRKWIIKGERKSNRQSHVIGTYEAEEQYDPGLGNFILDVELHGDLDGVWSGYDSANKKISRGRYKFFRIPKMEIRNVTEDDISTVIDIADQELGKDYIKESKLKDPEIISICAEVEGKIVGFATGRVLDSSDLNESGERFDKIKIPELEYTPKVGLVGSIATEHEYRKRGIGTALLDGCLTRLKAQGARLILMTAWKSPRGIHIGSIAEKHGFRSRYEVPNFWAEGSKLKQYSCSECLGGICSCTAVIFTSSQIV